MYPSAASPPPLSQQQTLQPTNTLHTKRSEPLEGVILVIGAVFTTWGHDDRVIQPTNPVRTMEMSRPIMDACWSVNLIRMKTVCKGQFTIEDLPRLWPRVDTYVGEKRGGRLTYISVSSTNPICKLMNPFGQRTSPHCIVRLHLSKTLSLYHTLPIITTNIL